MPLNLTSAISGTPTENDKRAAIYAIDQKNASLAAGETPLPKGNNTQIAASYKTILDQHLQYMHSHNLVTSNQVTAEQIKQAWDNATDQQRAAALAALQG